MIQKKIELAYGILNLLLKERNFLDRLLPLLERLKKTVEFSKEESLKIGMVSICAKCASEGKTCCGSGIEGKYSAELLTINLLLQVPLPKKPEIEGMCYFLSPKGCTLMVRDVFCINYICERIKEKLPPNSLKNLRKLEGEALEIQFTIEEKIKKLLKDMSERPFM